MDPATADAEAVSRFGSNAAAIAMALLNLDLFWLFLTPSKLSRRKATYF